MTVTQSSTGSAATDVRALDAEFRTYAGKVSRQSAVFFAGLVFTVGLGYPFKIYVARVIGASGLGLYTLGMTVVDFLSLFATLGLSAAAGRYVAVFSGLGQWRRLRRLLTGGLALTVVTSTLLAGAAILLREQIALGIFGEPALSRYLPLFGILLPVSVGVAFLGSSLRGLQEVTRRTVITTFIKFTVRIGLTLAFFALGWSLLGYILGELVSAILAFVLLFLVVRKIISRQTGADGPAVGPSGSARDIAVFAASMFLMGFLSFLSGRTDQVLVGVYLDARELGIYMAALTTAAFVPVFLLSLNSIFGPIIASLHAQGRIGLLERLLQITTRWALALTYPGVAVLLVFAPALMRLFGREFEAGAAVLSLVALGQLVNVGVGSVGSILVMSGNQRFEIVAVSISAALTLGLHLILIPRLGILGAAIAITVGIAFSNLLRLWMVRRVLGITPYNSIYLRLIIPCAISGLTVLGMRAWSAAGDWAYWVGILAGLALAYATFLTSAALLALDRDDRIIARAVWLRFRQLASSRS